MKIFLCKEYTTISYYIFLFYYEVIYDKTQFTTKLEFNKGIFNRSNKLEYDEVIHEILDKKGSQYYRLPFLNRFLSNIHNGLSPI